MSTESDQQRLPGMGAPEPHLDTQPRKKKGNSADPERCEFFCRDCGARITRSSSTNNEYGHYRSCEHHQVYEGGDSV